MMIWLFSALGWAKKAAQSALNLATKYPLQAALIALLALSAWLWRANNGLHDAIKAERAAHAQTVANYRLAQKLAEAKQMENLLSVAQAYTNINVRKENELKADRVRTVDRYERLLDNAKSYRSAPGNAEMSASTDAACVAYSGTPCAELPAKLKAAQDNTDQLVALIDWAKSVAAVPTSSENPQ